MGQPIWILLTLLVLEPGTHAASVSKYVPGEYVVQLGPELSVQDVLDKIPGAKIKKQYSIGSLHFAAVIVNKEHFDASLDNGGIDLVPNVVVEGFQDSQGPVCYRQETGKTYWGLTRISHVDLPEFTQNDSYLFNDTGECVNIYMMDTGVNVEHETFGGRARRGFTAEEIMLEEGLDDVSGHGTHVAGLAAGKIHGVAKHANIISVKVFNKSQSGSLTGILDGFDWISNQTKKDAANGKKVKNIINMSWGFHDPVWRFEMLWAIIDAIPAVAVAAAGNTGVDACEYAPARFDTVITVSATDMEDQLIYDFGHCVDVLAPGVNILSAAHDSNTGEAEKSGTSMAAGFVTGVIARHLGSSSEQMSTADVRKRLQKTSTKGKTNAAQFKTPDLLAYASCSGDSYVTGVPRSKCGDAGVSDPLDVAEIHAAPDFSEDPDQGGSIPKHLRDDLPPGPQVRVMGFGGSVIDLTSVSVISVTGIVAIIGVVAISVMCRCRQRVHNCDEGCEDKEPVVDTADTEPDPSDVQTTA